MKKTLSRVLITGSLVASLGVVTPSVAFASGKTATTHTSTSAWASFRTNWSAYGHRLKAIHEIFRTAVRDAHTTFEVAMRAASDRVARQAARTTLHASLEAALSARVAAITALGNPPPPPAGFNGSAWIANFQAANVAFRSSVTAAETAFVQATQNATTRTERESARLTLEAAIGAAMVTRSNALLALGAQPTKPGQPTP